jgi:hypothetical protein
MLMLPVTLIIRMTLSNASHYCKRAAADNRCGRGAVCAAWNALYDVGGS